MTESSHIQSESRSPDVTVVVPVYNGASTLERLVEGLEESLTGGGLSHEVVFVCDAPIDDSWAVVTRLAAERRGVRGYLQAKNFGQHASTLLGIRVARGRIVVTMDEDLQHDPRDVPRLVRAADTGALVYGVSRDLQNGVFRNATSRLSKWFLSHYLQIRNAADLSAFRAFPRQLREVFTGYLGQNVAIDVLLSWSGAPVRLVACQHAPRHGGQSGYTFRRLVAHLGNLAFGFSIKPLRFASYVGALSVGTAVLIGCYVVINWLKHGSAVPGFAFLALTVAALGGVQLLALGLLGEYMGRLYVDRMAKPQYVVAAMTPENPTEASTGAGLPVS